MSFDQTLLDLFEYNHVIRDQLLTSAAKLSFEKFTKDLGLGFSSIRDQLVHMARAKAYWLDNVLNPQKIPRPDPKTFSNASSLQKYWVEVEKRFQAFLKTFPTNNLDDKRSVTWGTETHEFSIRQILLHVATHEIHHRGQVVAQFRLLDHPITSPVDLL
ncbi:MAG: DinB family protein [Promethearchaeota archaeon]